jgi:DNA-binding beta-propeller fold protein YncE
MNPLKMSRTCVSLAGAAALLGAALFTSCGDETETPNACAVDKGAALQANSCMNEVDKVDWQIWAVHEEREEVLVISGPRVQTDRTISLAGMLKKPWGVTFDRMGLNAYVTAQGTEAAAYADGGLLTLSVLNLNVSKTTPLGRPLTLIRRGANEKLYALNPRDMTIEVINAGTAAIETSFAAMATGATGLPVDIIMPADGTKGYLVFDGAVGIIDLGTNTITGSYPTGAGSKSAALSNDGKLYVANSGTGKLSVIDLSKSGAEAVTAFMPEIPGVSSVTLGFDIWATGNGKTSFYSPSGELRCEIETPMASTLLTSPNCSRIYILQGSTIVQIKDYAKVEKTLDLMGGTIRDWAIVQLVLTM